MYAQNEKIKIKVPDNSHDVSIKSYIFQNGASSANRSIQFESFCKPIDAPRYSPGIAMYFLKQWLPNNFVIEGLSIGSYVDCFQTEFRGLEPYACGGDLIFRRLTKDDWGRLVAGKLGLLIDKHSRSKNYSNPSKFPEMNECRLQLVVIPTSCL